MRDDLPEGGTVKRKKTPSFTPQSSGDEAAMREARGTGGTSGSRERAATFTHAPAHKNRVSKVRTQVAIGKMKPAGEEESRMNAVNSEKASLGPERHPPEIVINHPSEDPVSKASQEMLSGQEDA